MKVAGNFDDRLVAFKDPTRHFRSTERRQTGILMYVHPGYREKSMLRNSTFSGSARMDSLLQAHSQSPAVQNLSDEQG